MSVGRRLLVLSVPALLAACADTPASPGPGMTSLVLRAVAPPSLASFGLNPTVDRVHASLLKFFPDESVDTIATRTVSWNANATTLNLSFNLVLSAAAETLSVELDYQTAAGRTLWVASQQVIAVAGQPTTPPPLVPSYFGPGLNVAALSILPRSATVVAGGTLNFSADAFDIQGAPIVPDSVYLSWGASSGQINALGTFTAPASPGAVKITVATPSLSGNADSVTINVLAAGAGALAGQVIDGASGAGLANVTLTVFDAQDVQVTTVQTASDGSYSTITLSPGLYRIVATLNGFLGATLFDATLSGGGASTVPTIPLVPSTTSPGFMSGVVKDATNNLPIPGATVELRDGVNATTSTPVATTTTDSVGGYSFQGPAGTYTVGAAATGFSAGYRTSVLLGDGTSSNQDVVLSPIGSGIVRIVLQWGAVPFDLDSHLTGPDSTTGSRFHVFFGDLGSLTARPYASQDVDDTDQFGPETITLSQQFPGVYRYSVHDYSDLSSTTSDTLANSGARVDLYITGQPVRSFFVPRSAGTLWTVFELNGTTVTPINTMTFNDGSTINVRGNGGGNDAAVIARDLRAKKH